MHVWPSWINVRTTRRNYSRKLNTIIRFNITTNIKAVIALGSSPTDINSFYGRCIGACSAKS